MPSLQFDIAHLLAGGMVVLSLWLLYQDRITATLNVFAMQAITLALSVAWQAYIQNAAHLMITAAVALVLKGIIIPATLHRIVRRLGIHREVEKVIGAGPTMLTGLFLVALAILLVIPTGEKVSVLAREDLAFALAVILLGLLMMITRRNAVTQIVGFMSLENGLVLAATGARGMPLVVEISVAFSVLIVLIVFGVFVFRIRERFDSVDVGALDRFRGERGEHRQ
jgi:hydrogenase-4 component E